MCGAGSESGQQHAGSGSAGTASRGSRLGAGGRRTAAAAVRSVDRLDTLAAAQMPSRLQMSHVREKSHFCLFSCCRSQFHKRYEAIGELCFGRKGKWAVAIGIILINLGAIIAYLVIVGDLVAPLIPVDWMRDVVIAVTTAIAFPLCLVRGRLLAMVSAASVLLVLGFTIMVWFFTRFFF